MQKVRGVARSTGPSPLIPATTGALVMVSPRATIRIRLVIGEDSNASTIVAA
jgi:hypothetical protein